MSSGETLRRTLLYHPSGVSTNRPRNPLSLEGEGQGEGELSVRIQVTPANATATAE